MNNLKPLIVAGLSVMLLCVRVSAAEEEPRWLLGASGAIQLPTTDFRDRVNFELNAERGDLSADYRVGTGLAVDGGGALRIWRRLVVGADVSYFDKNGLANVAAQLPHPFFFNRPRSVSGETGELRRTEIGLHILAGWLVPVNDRFDVLLTGGPSYIRVRQPLVQQVLFAEAFPFNSATFTGVTTAVVEDGGVGANVAADLTMLLTRHFGIGSRVRYSRASVKTLSADGHEVELTGGGLQIVAGLRARF